MLRPTPYRPKLALKSLSNLLVLDLLDGLLKDRDCRLRRCADLHQRTGDTHAVVVRPLLESSDQGRNRLSAIEFQGSDLIECHSSDRRVWALYQLCQEPQDGAAFRRPFLLFMVVLFSHTTRTRSVTSLICGSVLVLNTAPSI